MIRTRCPRRASSSAASSRPRLASTRAWTPRQSTCVSRSPGAASLELLLNLRTCRLDRRLGLGLGPLDLLGTAFADLLGLLLGAFPSGGTFRPQLVGTFAALGQHPLRFSLVVSNALLGQVGDGIGLLLGQREDLVDHRAEVPERRPVDLRRSLAHLGQLAFDMADLRPEILDLVVRPLTLCRQCRDLARELRDVLIDLTFVVTAHRHREAGHHRSVVAEREQPIVMRHA